MPIDKAGFFSTISFSWITKYLWVSYRKGITLDDLPKPSPYDTADHNAKRYLILFLLILFYLNFIILIFYCSNNCEFT